MGSKSKAFGIGLLCGVFVAGPLGFAAGVYYLPILTAEAGLDQRAVRALEGSATRSGYFYRDLPGSDALHWGDGKIMINATRVWLDGKISPGPDYRLYLVDDYVDTGADFLAIKAQTRQVGPIKAFTNFSLDLPADIDGNAFDAVVIWCEAFGQFITAARLEN